MKKTHNTPVETLAKIRRSVSAVSADYERNQGALRHKLRHAIHNVRHEAQITEPSPGFGSAWLPGPLSYPWLLMFAGVPKVIEHILRQI